MNERVHAGLNNLIDNEEVRGKREKAAMITATAAVVD